MEDSFDVIIVGSGLTGSLVARRLARAGLSCLMLEAGPNPNKKQARRLARSKPRDQAHLNQGDDACAWLRVSARGGRSLLWGGWCAFPERQNLDDARAMGVPWPLSLEELAPCFRILRNELGLKQGRWGSNRMLLAASRELGIKARPKLVALHSGGRRPLVASDLGLKGIELRAGCVVLRVLGRALARHGLASGVEYYDRRKRTTVRVHARSVVLCASPLETARLLWLSAKELGNPPALSRVGRRLNDQLTRACLVVNRGPADGARSSRNEEALAGLAAVIPRFVNTRGGARKRPYPSGFLLEIRGPLPPQKIDPAILLQLGLTPAKAARARFFVIGALGEISPSPLRFLKLADRQRDRFGRPLLSIHWKWDRRTRALASDMDESMIALAQQLATGPGAQIVALQPPGLGEHTLWHEASTCPMGRDAKDSVTDSYGRVHGVRGLYLADASVLPTALDRHPTMTVAALALRAADKLAAELAC